MLSTIQDAVPHDADIVIPVWSGLLVPKTQGVKEFMFNGGNAVTVCSNG